MEAVFLPKAEFEIMVNSLSHLKKEVKRKKDSGEQLMDNADFLQMMKIAPRTCRTWRQKKLIPFTKIGKKIFYKIEDVETLLNKNYIKK